MAGQLTEEQYREIKNAMADIAGVKADMTIIAALFPQLKEQYGNMKDSLKEIHDLSIAFGKVQTAIIGNGTKGLAQRVTDLETDLEKTKECIDKRPPKFSWKQVIANTIIIITAVGFVSGSMFFMIDDMSDKVKRLEDKIDSHIMAGAIP